MTRLASLLQSAALLSIATRFALGAFPIVFVLGLRWIWGKDVFDVAAAASNWSTYLNLLLLSGFAMVPPAVSRMRYSNLAGDAVGRKTNRQLVRDHLLLARWLVALGAVATVVLALTVDRTFSLLAFAHGAQLRYWFLLFAALALAQIPLALWLGIAQAAGLYRAAFALTALPRAAALLSLPLVGGVGLSPGSAIAVAVALVLMGQALLGAKARRALDEIDAGTLSGPAGLRRVLPSNLNAGLVGLVGTAISILPVTLVGRELPGQVGVAHIIVSISNAFGSLVVAAFFPLSLELARRVGEPGGLTRYCLRIARGTGMLSLAAILFVAVGGALCAGLLNMCSPTVPWTAALVLAGAGLRLGALGTQHAALYLGKPHLNLTSAVMEAVAALAILHTTLRELGLLALGVALLVGGALRFAVALSLEKRWLTNPGHSSRDRTDR